MSTETLPREEALAFALRVVRAMPTNPPDLRPVVAMVAEVSDQADALVGLAVLIWNTWFCGFYEAEEWPSDPYDQLMLVTGHERW